MDQSFCDFLVSVDKANLIKDNSKDFKEILDNVKDKHQEYKGICEYVIIPKNEFTQIVQSAVEDRKQISEIIDILEYSDYINKNPTMQFIQPHSGVFFIYNINYYLADEIELSF